jgi:hypothetical protein
MLDRCRNHNSPSYKYYGARGISVSRHWYVFENFLAEMGRRPSPIHSLDRINNEGNYEPGNVRWATPIEQAKNRRNVLYVTRNGRTLALIDWCREIGINPNTVLYRLRRGWSQDRALGTPVRKISR